MKAPAVPLRCLAIAALMVGIAACGSVESPQSAAPPQPLARVARVVHRHGDQIVARYPGANGVGVAAAEEEASPPNPRSAAFALLVTVESDEAVPDTPQQYSGIPIRFKVTGVIRAQ